MTKMDILQNEELNEKIEGKTERARNKLRKRECCWRRLQCDQKKIAKFLLNLPKNDFTRKMRDFDTFTKFP